MHRPKSYGITNLARNWRITCTPMNTVPLTTAICDEIDIDARLGKAQKTHGFKRENWTSRFTKTCKCSHTSIHMHLCQSCLMHCCLHDVALACPRTCWHCSKEATVFLSAASQASKYKRIPPCRWYSPCMMVDTYHEHV